MTQLFPTYEESMSILDQANALAHGNRYAPKCATCACRLYKDNFNGMWVCRDGEHGGYQTEAQVAALIESEILWGRGFAK